jgi:hypothetical protein
VPSPSKPASSESVGSDDDDGGFWPAPTHPGRT